LPCFFSVPAAPQSVLYIRPDTIGDLVIFSSALAQLRAAWPQARHALLVRPGYDALAPLFPEGLHWRVAPINPFTQKPAACRRELAALLAELEAARPDVIVAATLHRTWLEAAVAAHFPAARRVSLGGEAVDPLFATALRLELGIDAAAAFPETVPVGADQREWESNHLLVDQLTGGPTPRSLPALSVPAAAARQAAGILRAAKLPPGGFAAVFAAGLANVPIKAWPAERFAELVGWLQREKKLPVLLLGHETEAGLLEEVAAGAVREGAARPNVWLGRDGEIPLLAALLAQCRLYAGHDTGAMHLAAALGRPVVGIFGGGHWPRFRPVGRQVVSIVQPLPCFGCNWDCHWGDAPCVKTLALADVQQAVDFALRHERRDFDEVIEVANLPAPTLRLIAAATPIYRALQHDRLDRQHKIEELKGESDRKDVEITDLKRAAEERKTEMEAIKAELEAECAGKDEEIAGLKAEADTKDAEIDSLKQETDGKDVEIGALKEAANVKDREIAGLKAEADTKDAEIDRLKGVCNEREALIMTQDGHIKNFQQIVAGLNRRLEQAEGRLAELGAALAARDARLAELEAEKTRLEGLFAALPPGTTDYAAALQGKAAHVKHLEEVVAETRHSLANYVAGHSTLEHAKHYIRLLAEKEAVIQQLHQACVAREALIGQLAADATRPGAGLRKLWIAVAGHARLKWWQPLNAWLFRKVVEEYWMQIGVLQQYAPRPIRWDPRLHRRPRVAPAALPQIAIVTPSYNQPAFIESTMLSVLNQNYPKLLYVVQDGGSPPPTPQIIARYGERLTGWASAADHGQSDAVRRGFDRLAGRLGPTDVMAWLNSDDFINPRALRLVGEYFATHPRVDAVYGHRIIINEHDREIGRWVLPRHHPRSLEWIDYVPQETLFFRKRAWDLVGGVDPSFQFALDWDLLARFTRAGLRVVRLPYFLGSFRIHPAQKTSAAIHTTGADEMRRVRALFHGDERPDEAAKIAAWARRIRFEGALTARLHALGIRL
jgi:ADP-heptose:LPS heptosyltransferase/GT2 family glycosyltransferase/predicted  nucleic acid-binding Zn-ribbon protein